MRRGTRWFAVAAIASAAVACGARPPTIVPPLTLGASPPGSPVPEDLLPRPEQPIPDDARGVADALSQTTAALDAAVDRWVDAGDPDAPGIPEDVELLGLYQQRIYRLVSHDRALWNGVRPLLPRELLRPSDDIVAAARRLQALVTPISGPSTLRTGPPPPAGRLLRFFKEGERRFGVEWEVLAAVCYVESKFGRTRSASSAGAQGPMQFIPATWARYGMGGDVHDPHDAILGAANYLRASGAPGDYRSALFAYNNSTAYVDAILRYADVLRADARSFYALYSWQVFVVTTEGDRRLTGPGS